MRYIKFFTFISLFILSSVESAPFSQDAPKKSYHIEEHSSEEQNAQSCTRGNCPSKTSESCTKGECSAASNDEGQHYRYTLPKHFHSHHCRHRHFCCYGDVDEDWTEEDPTYPSKREQSWIDCLGR